MLFEEFVSDRGDPLLRLAFVLTGDRFRAEDLTQTVLAETYNRWSRISKANDPDAYVRKMLVHANIDWHRRRWSRERPVDMGQDVLTHVDHADQIGDQDEMRVLLLRLAPRARTVLVLRYYLDMDDIAIADMMNIKLSSVRTAASRALESLRGMLSEVVGEELA